MLGHINYQIFRSDAILRRSFVIVFGMSVASQTSGNGFNSPSV
jgi:hypothetical protein